MMRRSGLALALSPALLLGACVSVPKDAGFGDVSRSVQARAGLTVRWNRGGKEDAQAEKAVDRLLEGGLTADRAVQVALLENRDLQATYENLGIAQAALVQAGLLNNPVFAADGFPSAKGPTDLDFSLVQDFLDVFFRPLRKRAAADAFEAEKMRVTAAVLDLAATTRRAYYEYVTQEQLLGMRKRVEQAAAASYDAATRLYEAGNSRPVDLYNERALYERAKLDLASTQEAVIENREHLDTLLGLWGKRTNWKAEVRLPQLPKELMRPGEGVVKRALQSSLDLAAAREDIESAGERLGLAGASGLIPSLEQGPAVQRQGGEWGAGVTLAVPLPLFDQGQARKLAASSELARRRDRYVAVAVEVRSSARELYQRLVAMRRRALFYKSEVLPLQQRLVQQTQLLYNAMQVGVFQFVFAKQQEIEAAQRSVESLRDYWLARTDMEELLQGRRPREEGMRTFGMVPSSSQ